MMKGLRNMLLALGMTVVTACNRSELIEVEVGPQPLLPTIELDSETAVYVVKVGHEVVVEPTYGNVEHAIFSWKLEGKIISTEPILRHTFKTADSYFVSLRVDNRDGSAEEEIRIDVGALAPPVISFAIPGGGLEVVRGREYLFVPDVQNSDGAEYVWRLDGQEVGYEAAYAFSCSETGTHTVALKVCNEDGCDEKEVTVSVVDAIAVSATLPPRYYGDPTTLYPVSLGRTLVLEPCVWNGENPSYRWTVDGQEVATTLRYAYTPERRGTTELVFTVTDAGDGSSESVRMLTRNVLQTDRSVATLRLMVSCEAPEGTYRRPATAECQAGWNRIYEYTPAPGQFIHDANTGGFTGLETTPEAAVSYAEMRLREGSWVSLGAFGGYIVFGFDHSIGAGESGGCDFSVSGNQHEGGSEPGIVWVMQDVNGNGLPDDEWYELAGSDTYGSGTYRNHAVTYYRPASPGMGVQWRDNAGRMGSVDYLAAYHPQPYYYPNWVEGDSYTLYGTCLGDRVTTDAVTGNWVCGSYAWGYADNFEERNDGTITGRKNCFSISNAILVDGSPADLDYIDFIKVQTGVNAKAGWVGELSTEVVDVVDENLNRGE